MAEITKSEALPANSGIEIYGRIPPDLSTLIIDVNGPVVERTDEFYGRVRKNESCLLAWMLDWEPGVLGKKLAAARTTLGSEGQPAGINAVLVNWARAMQEPSLVEEWDQQRIGLYPLQHINPDEKTSRTLEILSGEYNLVFASNNPSQVTSWVLDRIGFRPSSDGHSVTIVGPDVLGGTSKPSREYFEALADYCGIDDQERQNTLVIGDDPDKEALPALESGFAGAILVQTPEGLWKIPALLENPDN